MEVAPQASHVPSSSWSWFATFNFVAYLGKTLNPVCNIFFVVFARNRFTTDSQCILDHRGSNFGICLFVLSFIKDSPSSLLDGKILLLPLSTF